ncbi:MAG: hypothetical protein SH856_14825 [Flavobacteriales bacterium]|nr:hypothetical protein [Flavobacteriales bacterium]
MKRSTVNMLLATTAILLTSLSSSAQAQGLDQAIGIRLGYNPGVTYQQYVADDRVLELIAASRYRGFSVTGLYEVHKSIEGVSGLGWFFGGGAHVGLYPFYANHPLWHDAYSGSKAVVGLDGILGLEYFIPDAPFMVSVDWKPAFDFYGYAGFLGDNGALSLRYRF